MTRSKQITDGVEYGGGTDPTKCMTYTYNLSGALIEQQYPSGRVVKNTLSNDGSLQQVQSRRASDTFRNYANAFTYNAAGAVSALRLGNGKWETTQFNSRLQPTQIGLGASASSQNLLRVNYTYNSSGNADNNGNVLSQTITVPTVGANAGFTANQTYTYDSLNRIKDAVEVIDTETWRQTFLYDRYGNRTFDTTANRTTTIPAGCSTAVCNPSVDAATNKLIGYQFDNSGNTKVDANGEVFIYDSENKQVQVNDASGIVGKYYYNGDGQRIKKVVPSTGETTIFAYDASNKLVAEYSTIVEPTSTGKTSYLTNDHLGSPRITTDCVGQVISRRNFMPFGEEIARSNYGTDSVRQKFTSYERDNESDLDYAQARCYKSAHGRFTSPDDFLNDTKAVEPASWNLYVYVRNNPVSLVDPDGEKVYVGGLSRGEKDEVLKRMNYTYGCQNCVSVDADGYLQVDTSNLSKDIIKTTQKLTDALNTTSWYAELQISNNDSNVAFGQGRQSRGAVPLGNGKKRNADLIVLDFGDDKWVSGDDQVKAAFLNTVLAHEILHFTLDPGKLTEDPLDDPRKTGKVVDAVNEILHARGLPLRERYGSFGQGGYWLSIQHGVADVKDGAIRRNSDGGIKVKANDTKKVITWLKKNVGGTGIN